MEKQSVLIAPAFERLPWLVHGFGTRRWTLADFKKSRELAGFSVVLLKQVHSDKLVFVTRRPRTRPLADALATHCASLLLVVKTADCLPVLLADDEKRVVAAVHCGWRGTQRRILERVVAGLTKRYGCRPAALHAALGPCIGASCYEVGEDVREGFAAAGLPLDVFRARRGAPGKFDLDLREANRRQLIDAGLSPRRIADIALCTHCDADLLSFRRDRDKKARLYNFIGIKV
jgi:polyphenol oxidase